MPKSRVRVSNRGRAMSESQSEQDSSTSIVRLLLAARALRDIGDGFLAIALPLYLVRLGYSTFAIAMLVGVALLGSALLTLLVGVFGLRYDARAVLLAAAGLMVVTGVTLAASDAYAVLLIAAFVGTVNPSGGSASPFVPVEHAVLSREAADTARTKIFARYSLVGGLAASAGAALVSLSEALQGFGLSGAAALRGMFAIYALLGVGVVALYALLPQVGSRPASPSASPLGPSRGVVYRLAALFSLDSFAGGMAVQSLLALWLFQHFELTPAKASAFFFWSGVLSSLSFPVAARLAGRFGLINTMVFTHIPSSLCLIGAAFAPNVGIALPLLLVRAALSQMDVPTRSSYVMAVVTEEERTAAASFTSVPRSLAASLSPPLAGLLYPIGGGAVPLLMCGTLKILYDLLLLAQFRRLRPPEEAATASLPRRTG